MGFGREVSDFVNTASKVYTTVGDQKYKQSIADFNGAKTREANIANSTRLGAARASAAATGNPDPFDGLDSNGNIKPVNGPPQRDPGLWDRIKNFVTGSGSSGGSGGQPPAQAGVPMSAQPLMQAASSPATGLPIGASTGAGPNPPTPGYADGGLVTPQPVAPPSNNPTAYTPPAPDVPPSTPAPQAGAQSAQQDPAQGPAQGTSGASPQSIDMSMDPVVRGLKFLQRTFGVGGGQSASSTSSAPDGTTNKVPTAGLPVNPSSAPSASGAPAPAPQQGQGGNGGLHALLTGMGAETNENVHALTKAVDPHNELTPGQKLYKGLEATSNFYYQIGDVAAGDKAAASLLQNYRQNMLMFGGQAVAAANTGDWKSTAALLEKAYDFVPDGVTAKVTPTANGVSVQRFDQQGKLIGSSNIAGATAVRDTVGNAMDFDQWAKFLVTERTQQEAVRHNQAQEGIEGQRNSIMAGDLALRTKDAAFQQGNITADRASGTALSSAYAVVSKATNDLTNAQASGDQEQIRNAQAALNAAKDAQFAAEGQAQPSQVFTMTNIDARNAGMKNQADTLAIHREVAEATGMSRKAMADYNEARAALATARLGTDQTKIQQAEQALNLKSRALDIAQQRVTAASNRAGIVKPGVQGLTSQTDRDQAYQSIMEMPEIKTLSQGSNPAAGDAASSLALDMMQSQPKGTSTMLAGRYAAGIVSGNQQYQFDPGTSTISGPAGKMQVSQQAAAMIEEGLARRSQAPAPATRGASDSATLWGRILDAERHPPMSAPPAPTAAPVLPSTSPGLAQSVHVAPRGNMPAWTIATPPPRTGLPLGALTGARAPSNDQMRAYLNGLPR